MGSYPLYLNRVFPSIEFQNLIDQDNLKLFLSLIATDGKDKHGLKRFQFLNAKISKKILWLELLEKSCLTSSS